MKIVTWNINSLRLRLGLVEKITTEYNPDFIALQETKVTDSSFPIEAIQKMGYEYIYYTGGKSYNGVAILSKIKAEQNFMLKFYNDDHRHIAIKIDDYELHNFYIPAGGDIADESLNPKFKHKLSYLQQLENWLIQNRKKSDKIILVGDLNIAPHEHDVWSSRALRNEVSHTDIERIALIKMQNSLEFIDTARHFVPFAEKSYSWWSYRNIDWQKSNRGRRLDHIWITPALKPCLASLQTLKHFRGYELPSDHVPLMVTLHA